MIIVLQNRLDLLGFHPVWRFFWDETYGYQFKAG